nr:MAG TPA: hypothetical protein [Caudoviricetes sp.]
MKYKVGDKVRVRSYLNYGKYSDGVPFTHEMDKFKGTVIEVRKIAGEFYEMVGIPYIFTDEMLEPVEEMTAEELAKIIGNICEVHNECKECPFRDINGEDYCVIRMGKNVDKTLKIAKQWKADYEKKPIETEFGWYMLVVEEKTHIVKCEKPLKIRGDRTTDEQKEDLLRGWCSEHDGKYYVTTERRCVVKE